MGCRPVRIAAGTMPIRWADGLAVVLARAMRLLVTGGAGYVGSVVAAQLLEAGHQVVVLDDLSAGHADAVPDGAVFVRGTVRDRGADVLAGGIDAVLHFAAKSLVGESVARP